MGMGSMGIGLILAFVFGWKLTLVILAFVPVVMIGGAFQVKVLTGFTAASKEGLLEAGKVIIQ